ncbi:MAG: hypothetical protein A2868_02710 [Candidatus Levybacteria bacterium RIFCSPHIGHO2_01_FULL_40_15b]|nr:MAG: hypothetical protein A2868_02710 [Candidatus Levybacteria bacterium RIFCSPHIGHO2_01_FULL_40_15b]
MNNLPTSIKTIGWLYTLIGLIITGFFCLLSFSQLINPTKESVSIFTTNQKTILSFLGIIYGICVFLVAQGILRKNNISWYLSLVLILPIITNPLLILFNLFFAWKLIQHRKYFNINWF